jgi:putative membrane protein
MKPLFSGRDKEGLQLLFHRQFKVITDESLARLRFLAGRWLASTDRVYLKLLTLWLLSMVSVPIVKWLWGSDVLIWIVPLNTVLQVGLVLWVLWQAWGASRTLRAALVVAVTTLVIEAVGTTTGFPFGHYAYTDALQPQWLHVPLVIPLAWLMMLPVAWAVARQITGQVTGWRFVSISALAMTTWDLLLDPQMVAWGFWVWHQPGGYFGIPWLNFAGWFLTAAAVTLLVRPQPVPVAPLLPIFGLVWFLETFGLFVWWNLPGPAVVGGLAMGSLLIWAGLARSAQTTAPVVDRRPVLRNIEKTPAMPEEAL